MEQLGNERLLVTPWYLIEDEDTARRELISALIKISEGDFRLEEHTRYLKLYSGLPQLSTLGFYNATNYNYLRTKNRLREKYRVNYNVVKSVIDTLVAKACLNPPKATLITEGGDICDRLMAHRLDKAIYMVMKQGGVFKSWAQFVKQALVHGDCEIKVYADLACKQVKFEKILPPDLYVHNLDAMYGDPTCKYQTTFMRKDILFAKYPAFEEVYFKKYKTSSVRLDSQFISKNKIDTQTEYAEYVELLEAWKIKTSPRDKGRHMIVCRYGTILDESYEEYTHRFARLSWNRPHIGYYSDGVASQLSSKQDQINMILSFMTEAAEKSKSPKLVVYNQDLSKSLDIKTNDIGQILNISGTSRPEWLSFGGYPPTEFERLQWLIRSCYEEVGLNQMSSTGKNIIGSGASKVALQEFTDIESDRFQEFGKALDNFMVDLCGKTILALKDLKKGGVKELYGSYNGAYCEVDLEKIDFEDDYDFTIVTSSMLPMSSSVRKDFVSDLYNSGIIDSTKRLELLQMPDLEQYNKITLAPRTAIEMQIEKIIDTKDEQYILVNENFDLKYGLQFVTALLCQYSYDMDTENGDTAKILNLLEQFKVNLTIKLQEMQAVQQQLVQQLQAAPIGNPAQVSVSSAPSAS